MQIEHPSSRTRVHAAAVVDEDDPLEQLQRRRDGR
jgi:hypothetical protein